MAAIYRISCALLLLILGWGAPAVLPAVAQLGPERSKIGPELTSFVPPRNPVRDKVVAVAMAEVGTREIGPNNHGPGPKKYLAACGLPEGYAYCACFVKWVLLQAGIKTQGTAWSPSWATGKEVFWKQGKGKYPPREGDVFTLYYASMNRVGHVGLIHTWQDPRADDWVFTVEGNTNGEGSREGDGVHRRRRLKRSIYTIANFLE